jgi:transcription factor CP2-like protein
VAFSDYSSVVFVFIRAIAPRLTLYLCVEQSSVYHALYLDSLSCAEMASRLAQLMGITADQIHDVYVQGPGGIHVLITDDVVRNIKDESMFTIEILHGEGMICLVSIIDMGILHHEHVELC